MLISNFNVGMIHFVSLVPSERTCSALRYIKTYLRSTMMQDRLNRLLATYVHKEELDKLDLRDVGHDFVKGHEHRLSIFGTFYLSKYLYLHI